jgi:hypothetical protein
MWYHPCAVALGWRDVVAAWIVCFAAAALLFCYGLSAAEADADPRFAAARSTISQKSFIAEAMPAGTNFSAQSRIKRGRARSTAHHAS